MLNEIGGLAGGLAQGLNMGMQWKAQRRSLDLQEKYQDRLAKSDERDAEIHTARMDEYNTNKKAREKRTMALQEIDDYTKQAFAAAQPPAQQAPQQAQQAPQQGSDNPAAPGYVPPQQPTPSGNVQLAGPAPAGGLAMAAPGGVPPPAAAGGLMQAQPPAQPPAQQDPQQAPKPEQSSPGQSLTKGMITGAYTPKMLTDISNIFAKHGLHEEGMKYMEQAYTAEKRGVGRAAMSLMQDNVDGAIEALKNGGVTLEDKPVKVKPNDSNDHNWKINIAGQGEKTINVKDWLATTMDVDKFFDHEDKKKKQSLDQEKHELDKRKTQAEIGVLGERGRYLRSQSGKADRYEPGLGSSRSSDRQIDTAINRRDKELDRRSMVPGDDGKPVVDPEKRSAYDKAAYEYQDLIEQGQGEELDARQHHKLTDALLTYPVGGTPQQIREWQGGLMRRMGGEGHNSGLKRGGTAPESATPAGGGLAPAKTPAPAAKPKAAAQPTQDEQELHQVRFNAEAQRDLKKMQRERTASNLSKDERAKLEADISALIDRAAPKKARVRAPSSDPESAPANYGKRQDGTDKGRGWLGVHKSTSGNDMTEYTVGVPVNGKQMDIPTFVPGLTPEELAHLKTEPDLRKRTAINDSIIEKAVEHARKRVGQGKSVFAD